MSKALKCDRCKKCFDPYSVEGEFANIRELYYRDPKSIQNNEVTYRDDGLDLCPDCTRSFTDWLVNADSQKTQGPL